MEEAAAIDVAAFIAANLPAAADEAAPEIRLHRAGPASGLNRLAQGDPNFTQPYWAYAWGGGRALARHVLDHPETVRGRRVLDLGCGGGIVAIAAALAGAGAVTAVDADPYATAAVRLNAALNGVEVEALTADLLDGPPTGHEVLLVGDLFYAADLAARVAAFLDRCAQAGAAVLVGDPRRATLPLERLEWLADYAVSDFGESAPGRSAVFAFASPLPSGLRHRITPA